MVGVARVGAGWRGVVWFNWCRVVESKSVGVDLCTTVQCGVMWSIIIVQNDVGWCIRVWFGADRRPVVL